MEYQYIICHYAEIGLKGKNRRFFEEKLIENIKRVLKPEYFDSVRRISGRIIVKINKKGAESEKEIRKVLEKVFGIAFFAFAFNTKQDIKSIKEKAFEVLKDEKFRTFKISTQRSKKEFHLDSQKINEKVGQHILKNNLPGTPSREGVPGRRPGRTQRINVDLKNPDITCFIEIVEKYAFLYTEKIKGLGGLPTGVSRKAVVLLSGGIDSPVAGFQIMKRGVKAVFVHFHASPFTSKASIDKNKKIAKILNEHQGKSKLYLVPFADIQKEIFLKTSPKLRVILYRRFMFRIAQEIAKKEKALVLVTGESIGQVASQTLENIKVIEQAVDLPVFRPLIGQDKEEIIGLAKKIGTFDISILPHDDCCTRFLPKHPETKAKIQDIKGAEKELDVEKLVRVAIEKTKIDKI